MRHRVIIIKTKTKIACAICRRLGDKFFTCLHPITAQHCVGMEKEQVRGRGPLGTGAQLLTPAFLTVYDTGPSLSANGYGIVTGAAIAENNLANQPGLLADTQRLEGRRQAGGFI